jgi:undecaprenyl-diphosphatase
MRAKAVRKARRVPALVAASTASAGALAVLARAARSRGLRPLDEAVRLWFREHRHPAARLLARGGDAAGKAAVLVPVATAIAGLLVRRRGLRSAAMLPLAPLAATAVQRALKPLVRAPRPPRAVREGKTAPSFPSGHAAASASLAWTLARVAAPGGVAPRVALGALAVLWPAVASAAKLYRERHWLTDVLGGLAVGAAITAAIAAIDAPSRPSPG